MDKPSKQKVAGGYAAGALRTLACAAVCFWLGNLLAQVVTGVMFPQFAGMSAMMSNGQPAPTADYLGFIAYCMQTQPLGLSFEPTPVIWGLVAALIGWFTPIYMGRTKSAAGPNIYGNAKYATLESRAQYAHTSEVAVYNGESKPWPKPDYCEELEDDNLIVSKRTMIGLSQNPHFAIRVPNTHTYMIAGSGSGKTYSFVQTNAMQLNGSAMFTDPKSENFQTLAPLYEAHGYAVKYLDLRGGEYMQWSMRYNPMHYVNSMTEIAQLADMFIQNTKSPDDKGDDQFFTNMEKIVYSCLLGYFLFYFKKRGGEESCNIPTMLDFLALTKASPSGCTGLELVFYGTMEKDGVMGFKEWLVSEVCGGDEAAARQRPEWAVLSNYDGFVATAGSPETMASVVSSCYARLRDFANADVRRMLSADDLELDQFGKKKMVLFLILPDGGAGTFSFVASMVLHQLFHVNMAIADSSASRHLDIPINCYLDELANIGKLPELDKLFATLRSRWINLFAIVQDSGQLENVAGYGKAARSIYSNAAITLYYGGSDYETAKKISEEMGTWTEWYPSRSESKSASGTSVSTSMQAAKRDLMSAQEMTSEEFGNFKCLTHYKNTDWFLDDKPDPTAHKRWAERCATQKALERQMAELGCTSPVEAWAKTRHVDLTDPESRGAGEAREGGEPLTEEDLDEMEEIRAKHFKGDAAAFAGASE